MIPSSNDHGKAGPSGTSHPPTSWAMLTFFVLFAINLLDFTDRWALAGVLPYLQAELKINDAAAGSLNTYFLISYAVLSPLMGWAGDRFRRTHLLAAGIGLWSLATVGTGLSQDYNHLCLARSLLGVGEATYAVLAPSLLMDLFDRKSRSKVLAGFYLAMPLGFAVGVMLGAYIAGHSKPWVAGTFLAPYGGWRLAFFVVGLPGLLAAIAALFLPEPIRGLSEGVDPERLRQHEKAGASWADYVDLMVNSSYTYVVFGLCAYTFAFGGLAYWLPSFLERVKGLPADKATMVLAGTTLAASLVGMAAGGWLADYLAKTRPKALFVVPGVSMLLAVPCVVLALLWAQSTAGIIGWLFLAEALMLANTGPSNAVIANVVSPNMRATAFAASNFAVHVLGDVWSPWLMGLVSDYLGQPDTAATSLGRTLASVGIAPVGGKNLMAGMLIVVPAVALGGLVLLAGARHLPREMALMLAKLKAPPASTLSAATTPSKPPTP